MNTSSAESEDGFRKIEMPIKKFNGIFAKGSSPEKTRTRNFANIFLAEIQHLVKEYTIAYDFNLICSKKRL